MNSRMWVVRVLPLLALVSSAVVAEPDRLMESHNRISAVRHVASGQFESHQFPLKAGTTRVTLQVAILNPRGNAQWAAASTVCVQGQAEKDYSCVRFGIYLDQEAVEVTQFDSPDVSSSEHLELARPLKAGTTATLEIETRSAGAVFTLDGKPLPTKGLIFKPHSILLACSSATCRYDVR